MHSWLDPMVSMMSGLTTCKMALLMILLGTSPIPIGLTPGHLSSAISLEEVKACRGSGSTQLEEILQVQAASAAQRS